MVRFLAASVVVVVVVVSFMSAEVRAEDHREVQGRALFAKGDYQAALDIYANLFGEKGDAIYLRNIGRCYQKLQQPDKSIDAFREYLRRGHVKPPERSEVEGFISEMEQLQKERAAAAPTAPPPPVEPVQSASAPAAASPPSVPAVGPAPASNSAPGATLTQQATTDNQESTPITHRWWFWTGIGAVVAAGVVTAIVLSSGGGGSKPPCTASTCL